MTEYSSLLSDAVLRHRARVAEHSARIEAELASKVKSEFIANMSHELKTPLNTVIGFSKLLTQHEERRLPDKEIVEYARLINDAAGHLLSVINDILDISKLQSGKYSIDTREIDIEGILTETIETFRRQSEAAQIDFHTAITSDLPFIRGDGAKLKQIFSNIFSNAIKFTPPDGTVAIKALRTADQGVIVVIRDSGVGMNPEEIEVAMTPFGQVDGGRSRWREGAGLGLPIAKALVELHGGTLYIASQQNEGTEVVITFPGRDTVTASAAATMYGARNPAA
ncbi:MAG TPA: HAMP domain-containing sensor histidine kinase [Hyphomicrobium sp.]|nr:HAMP domain-containing sensor histidine kinase [Hyphomicrobium sp.]